MPASAWHVYMLRCADGTLYTGVTNNLRARLAAHNSGKGAKYTRARCPVELLWSTRAKDKSAAHKREYHLKQLTRAEKLQVVIKWQQRRAIRKNKTPG